MYTSMPRSLVVTPDIISLLLRVVLGDLGLELLPLRLLVCLAVLHRCCRCLALGWVFIVMARVAWIMVRELLRP